MAEAVRAGRSMAWGVGGRCQCEIFELNDSSRNFGTSPHRASRASSGHPRCSPRPCTQTVGLRASAGRPPRPPQPGWSGRAWQRRSSSCWPARRRAHWLRQPRTAAERSPRETGPQMGRPHLKPEKGAGLTSSQKNGPASPQAQKMGRPHLNPKTCGRPHLKPKKGAGLTSSPKKGPASPQARKMGRPHLKPENGAGLTSSPKTGPASPQALPMWPPATGLATGLVVDTCCWCQWWAQSRSCCTGGVREGCVCTRVCAAARPRGAVVGVAVLCLPSRSGSG